MVNLENFGKIDAVRARDICVERGGRQVIADLSFEIAAGQALLLTGPNGAGKTTLIRAMAGLLPLSGGEILAGNVGGDAQLGEYCHYVAHANAAKPELTVTENLTFWRRFLGGAALDEDAAMGKLGLAGLADIPVRYLSAGQQRRVAIGRLLVAERAIWLLDEPTVSLDAVNVGRLVEVGNEHLARGGIIVAATHTPLGFEPMVELALKPVELAGPESAKVVA